MGRLNSRALVRLRDTLQRHIEKGRIPGAVSVVALGGHVEALDVLGLQDARNGTAMRQDAIFRIYSMTKPLVSLATLILSEEGALQLGDPVALYLPEFGNPQVGVEEGGALRLVPAKQQPTIHDLLRHTAGFTYGFLGSNAVQRKYNEARVDSRSRNNAEFCKLLASLPLADEPGSIWQYGHATDVLGGIIEKVSGLTLGDFLSRRIFEPLGMKDTAFSVPKEKWHRIAEPFEKDPDSGETIVMLDPKVIPAWESGGGGLMSTAADYLSFLQLMRNKGSQGGIRLISRKTAEWMTSDHVGSIPVRGDLLLPGYGFGLGFTVRLHDGMGPQPGSAGQYYWSGIGGTSFFVDPREDIFALLLTQAPNQRIYFRNMFRSLVYAALD